MNPSRVDLVAGQAVGGDVATHGTAAAAISDDASSGMSAPSAVTARRHFGVGLQRFSALYGLVALILLFSYLHPALFPTSTTFTLILSNQAVTGLLALGALVPLAAGCIDLSFASVAGFAAVFASWLSTNTRWNDVMLVLVVILASTLFGLLSGMLVTGLKLNSFVVTLGMSSVALGFTEYIANGNTMTVQLGKTLTTIGQGGIGVVPWMAVIMLVVAVLLYVWMEHTASGRFVLATGSNESAARLTGIRVGRLQLLSLVFAAAVAGAAGILIDASVGSVSEVTASGYLLPAIAAVFLGSTQVKSRPNVIGTVVAVYLLGTGIKGLQLEGAAAWINDFFNGAVLLLAVVLSGTHRLGLGGSGLGRALRALLLRTRGAKLADRT